MIDFLRRYAELSKQLGRQSAGASIRAQNVDVDEHCFLFGCFRIDHFFCMLDHGIMLGRTDTIRKRVRMAAEAGMKQNSFWSCFSFQALTSFPLTPTDSPPKVHTV
jgi:hypothetical protein